MTLHKNKKIRVGISLRIERIEKYNEIRDAISQDWIKLLKMQKKYLGLTFMF